jgi:hypothetical protein
MSQNKYGMKILFAFLLAVSLALTTRGQASTITVVPSEVQSQIQASINNSHTGDTIAFQAGTYNICNLHLAAGRTYLGATNGTTVVHWPGACSLMIFYGTGLTLQHFTFDGGGLYLGGAISNAHVEYNTFRNIPFGPNSATEYGNWTTTIGVFIDTSATNSDISHNTFQNLSAQILNTYGDWNLGVTGIFGFNLNNVTITYNTFNTLNEGIHLFAVQNSQINYNTISNFHRIGMEIQNHVSNLEIGHNTFTQPITPYWITFGISAAITGGNANIHDNMIDDQTQKQCGAKCWIGYGVEAWGVGTVVKNNTIQGHWGNGVAIGPSTNLQVVGNKICGPDMALPGNGYVVNQRNTKWAGELVASNATSTGVKCN